MTLSLPARAIVSVIRKHRLNYDGFRKAAHQARQHLRLKPSSGGKRLPKLPTQAQLAKFFEEVDKGGNLQHQLMLRLLLQTGLRRAEFVKLRMSDVDLANNLIVIERGKGDKDRRVLFRQDFKLALKTYIETHADNEYLFESRQRKAYSPERLWQIVRDYAERAGVEAVMHPHAFRHLALTHLTRKGLTDAQIQLVSGHASRESLKQYQHLSLADVAADYQNAMKDLGG